LITTTIHLSINFIDLTLVTQPCNFTCCIRFPEYDYCPAKTISW